MTELLPELDERALFAGTFAVLLVATGAVAALGGFGAGGPSPQAQANSSAVQTTADGTRYTVHPRELRQGCPGGMDCIPSIDDPTFQSAADAGWLADSDLVIGVEIDGEARAYPLRILNVHEIVNDRVAGEPIAVTYCPLCRSGLVFSREAAGSTLSFGVSGQLYNANLVMYDRQTGTYWSQVKGQAIVGQLVPTVLEQLPSTITTWGQWRAAHPDTQVLSRDTGIYPPSTYDGNPYSGYEDSERVGFGVEPDPRLPAKALVFGVTAGNASRAYPADDLRAEGLVTDEVGGVPVVLLEDPRDGSVRVFDRTVDGEVLEFTLDDGVLVDQHGHRWSLEGEALDGPHAGTTLVQRPTHELYWFAWASFHPETDVYGMNGTG